MHPTRVRGCTKHVTGRGKGGQDSLPGSIAVLELFAKQRSCQYQENRFKECGGVRNIRVELWVGDCGMAAMRSPRAANPSTHNAPEQEERDCVLQQ